MNKLIENIKKHLIAHIITLIISLIIGVAIFLLMFYLNERSLYDAINGTTISFVVLFSFGVLIWVGNNGLFDGMTYGFGQIFTSAFSKKPNKMNDYPAYVQGKNAKRKNGPKIYLSFILSGLLFAIAMIILLIIN